MTTSAMHTLPRQGTLHATMSEGEWLAFGVFVLDHQRPSKGGVLGDGREPSSTVAFHANCHLTIVLSRSDMSQGVQKSLPQVAG